MVKQFTIPCQFDGGKTSPVTLYIGHPEMSHHPVHFQSDWLSSAKGGSIPQDLMDTLQKLHDLANENGADFEELCYYALISATQHGVGASKDDINKYADEYIKKDGNIENDAPEGANEGGDTGGEGNNDSDASSAGEAKDEEKNTGSEKTNDERAMVEAILSNIPGDGKPENPIMPTIGSTANTSSDSGKTTGSSSVDEDLLNDIGASIASDGSSSSTSNGSGNTLGDDAGYSTEDEDLLLMDDDD